LKESSSDDLQLPEKQTPRGPKQDLPGRLSGDFRINKLEKIVADGEGKKRSILQVSVKCVLHIRSKVKLDIFVNSV
jgi:hypothetical protein